MAPAPPSSSRVPWLAAAVAVIIALSFAGFTGHIWEDYFITFRASLNLASGHGLVFQAGERVHSFTSPLGTLLPALFAGGGGDDVAVRALWWFRATSALALASAVWLILRAMTRSTLAGLAVGVTAGLIVLDPKIVDFSINGMECAWVILFVIVTWRAFTDGARLLPCALGFAGLQWTRPDGCIYFGAIAAAWLVCGAPPDLTFRARVRAILRPIGLGALFYLPWVLWAWSYYGSPVPHTIIAKVNPLAPGELPWLLALYPWKLLFGHVALHYVYLPSYFYFGDWPHVLWWISRLMAVAGAVAWLVPGVRPAGRVASGAFFLGGFYLEYIPRSPWYFPGWQILGLVAGGYLLDAALRAPARPVWAVALIPRVARIVAVSLVVIQAGLLGAVAYQTRLRQQLVEDGNRRQIGEWLRTQAAAGDRVYLEPLGYIGYYSGLKMLDYPGLASPEVVAARRAGYRPHAQIIAALRPEWIVLRAGEVQDVVAGQPQLLGHDYGLARVFDVRAKIDALTVLPGRGYLELDALFLVFHRTPAAPSS